MDLHMDQNEILALLKCGSRQDLSIPDKKRLEIPRKPFIAKYLQSLEAYAEKFRGTPIPALPYSAFRLLYETGDRRLYEDGENGYFPRRGRLAAFAALAWLYGRKEDLSELCDVIWAVCDEYTWAVPAHLMMEPGRNAFVNKPETDEWMVDLFAAETGQALTEILFLLGDQLPEIVRRRVMLEVDRRIFKRVLEQDFGWMTNPNNWSAVCAGSVGMAAICAIEDEGKLANLLARILPAFQYFLSGFAEDGSCLEGIGYWSYGFSYFTSFADMLHRRTGGKLNLFADEKVHRIAAFQQKCYFPCGRTVSFSDGASRSHYHPGVTSYLSKKYDDVLLPPTSCSVQDFSSDHCYRWTNVLHDLLWSVCAHESDALPPQTYLLPAAQWYLSSKDNGVSLAAKAGCNDEPHNHNDIGSFQVFYKGEELFADLGSGEYTRQYFSDERYSFLVCGSQGHSVPMIDGCTQRAGKDACAKDVRLTESGISMELASAYQMEALYSLKRSLVFDSTVTLTDEFVFTGGEHAITERFVTYADAQTEDGCVRLVLNGQKMRLRYDAERFSVRIIDASFSAHLGLKTECRMIDLTAKAEGSFTARFVIEPADQ